jgi:glycosyltransferase involved in cell wall biosynthesis
VISVITCTHNPRRDYLLRVLEGLRQQSLDLASWEFLLIDNASTQPVASETDLAWHPRARLIHEESLGLTHARLRGIREAKGDFLIFVDDDNVLAEDFLAQAEKIAQQRTDIGAWSGQCFPEFEATPPAWTRRYWGMLVAREFDRDVWSNLPHLAETMPCGAGLCVRRCVAEHYLALHERGRRNTLLDRRGKSLMSAGDNDLAACACELGLSMGLYHKLKLAHLIPADRLSQDYLVRLAEGIHYSGVFFRSLRGEMPQPVSFGRRLLNLLQMLRMSQNDRLIFRAVCRGERKARQSLAKSDPNVPNSDLRETNCRTSQSVTVPNDNHLMIAGMNTSHRADCEPHSQGAIH